MHVQRLFSRFTTPYTARQARVYNSLIYALPVDFTSRLLQGVILYNNKV